MISPVLPALSVQHTVSSACTTCCCAMVGAPLLLRMPQVLKQLAETHKSRPFSYLWAEAGAQPGLEAAVGVGGCGAKSLLPLRSALPKAAMSLLCFERAASEESTAGLKLRSVRRHCSCVVQVWIPSAGGAQPVQAEVCSAAVCVRAGRREDVREPRSAGAPAKLGCHSLATGDKLTDHGCGGPGQYVLGALMAHTLEASAWLTRLAGCRVARGSSRYTEMHCQPCIQQVSCSTAWTTALHACQ
jgi:hypothetical protein